MANRDILEIVAEKVTVVRGAVALPRDAEQYTPAMLEALSEIVTLLAAEIGNLQVRLHELDGLSPGRLE